MNKIANKFFKASFGNKADRLEDVDLNTEKGRKELELISLDLFKTNQVMVKDINDNIEQTNNKLRDKIEELQYKINKTVEKVRGAILAERGTSGAIYTTQIPINRQQISTNTTTKIQDGIAFGVPENSEEFSSELSLLQLKNLEFDNLYLSSLNKYSNDALRDFTLAPKTQNNLPIEFKINLNGVIRTASSLVIELKTHGIIEIYKNGQLITEKSLIKNIIVPVDINTLAVSIRSYPSIHRTSGLTFNQIGYTELIYDSTTYFETKNININKDFNQIVIDTCDNSNDKNIDIKYFISINDQPYEGFSPVIKHKALEKQSIITVDKTQILNMYESEGVKYSEGDYRFLVPNNLQTNLIYMHEVFLRNNKKLDTREFIITIKEDVTLDKRAILSQSSDRLFINDKEILDDTFVVYKGIMKLVSISGNNEIQPINLNYIETLLGESNIYIGKIQKELLTNSNGEKYISLSIPEFKDSFDTAGKVYFPGIKPKQRISTIKIKAELQSLDKRTVPFISRLLVRGM